MATIQIIAADEFGVQVGEALRTAPHLKEHDIHVVNYAPDLHLMKSDILMFVSNQPSYESVQYFESSGLYKIAYLPITTWYPTLYVGPVISSSHGICYECFLNRRIQHSTVAGYIKNVSNQIDTDPSSGVAGFLPLHADLAAGLATNLILPIDHSQGNAEGLVFQVNLLTFHINESKVIGFHGCRTCDSGREEATRSYTNLAARYIR